jgi:hypothetical protein
MNDILFSVDEFDKDGDISDHGIYLHFGDTRVKVAHDKNDFLTFVKKMEKIFKEIDENY